VDLITTAAKTAMKTNVTSEKEDKPNGNGASIYICTSSIYLPIG